MVLLDIDVKTSEHNYDDSDNFHMDIVSTIDPNEPVAYLDQLNVAPVTTAYLNVLVLSSQIGFVAPANLFAWVYLTLGLSCVFPL